MQAKPATATPDLAAAFNEWQSGLIYVCKKTGHYRYRRGLSVAPWSQTARTAFSERSEFERAAAKACPKGDVTKAAAIPKTAAPRRSTSERANVIDLAKARKKLDRTAKVTGRKAAKATKKAVRK